MQKFKLFYLNSFRVFSTFQYTLTESPKKNNLGQMESTEKKYDLCSHEIIFIVTASTIT